MENATVSPSSAWPPSIFFFPDPVSDQDFPSLNLNFLPPITSLQGKPDWPKIVQVCLVPQQTNKADSATAPMDMLTRTGKPLSLFPPVPSLMMCYLLVTLLLLSLLLCFPSHSSLQFPFTHQSTGKLHFSCFNSPLFIKQLHSGNTRPPQGAGGAATRFCWAFLITLPWHFHTHEHSKVFHKENFKCFWHPAGGKLFSLLSISDTTGYNSTDLWKHLFKTAFISF